MTLAEYYEILGIKWKEANKENLEEIKEYNRFKHELRKEIEENGKDNK